ncbi:MAG: SPOR domain-containing protein [Pseudomonadota bacterium]
MADVEFSHGMGAYSYEADGPQSETAAANTLTTLTNVAGALISLALIAGVGVWGYKLMVRDVSGVPVVRAAEGAMRVRPEEPGGVLAQHQGLAVNEIAAKGSASGPVDQVTLAPKSIALAEEDQPMIAPRTAPIEHPAPLTPAGEATRFEEVAAKTRAKTDADALQKGAINAVMAELSGAATSLSELDGPKTVSARATGVSDQRELVSTPAVARTNEVITAPGPRRSARPRLRPADSTALLQKASFTLAATSEIDASKIPSGTRLVQLGAFETPEVARAEWARLDLRFGDVLQDKSRVIEEAQSSGRTFYRLRAMGFVDLSDARRFCSAFKAEGVDCIPVQVK